MRYLSFEISHYKGVTDTVNLDLAHLPQSKIFTLVGLNESGKTSILEAISLLQNDIDPTEAHKLIHVNKKGNYNGDISVKATLSLDEDDELRIADFCKQNCGFTLTSSIGRVSVKKVYKFKLSKFADSQTIWDVPLKGKKNRARNESLLHEKDIEAWRRVVDFIESNFPRILFYENFLFELPERIYLDRNAECDRPNENSRYRDVIQDILDSFEDNRTVDQHLLQRYSSDSEEDKSALDACKSDIESRLTDVILKSWNNVFAQCGDEIIIEMGKDNVGVYLQLKIKQGRAKYLISERSLGFRWFFSFLLFTQFRKARKDDFGETLFLLDEPASNLHPKSQSNLLNVFNQLSTDCKIIYSTHSHHLIDPKNLPGTYIVKNEAINYENEIAAQSRETDIHVFPYRQFASSYPDEKDHFKPILDAIDYMPSALEMKDDIICLEGKNDYYTFKLMKRFVAPDVRYSFYPGASADKYDPLFRLYLAWGKNFYALFDGDKAGVAAKERYVKELGPDVNGHIFTLSDIDATWKGFATESLFSPEDKLKICRAFFEDTKEYNKGRFNTGLQQLYVDGSDFKFSEATIENFTKAFSFLNSLLNLQA